MRMVAEIYHYRYGSSREFVAESLEEPLSKRRLEQESPHILTGKQISRLQQQWQHLEREWHATLKCVQHLSGVPRSFLLEMLRLVMLPDRTIQVGCSLSDIIDVTQHDGCVRSMVRERG